MPVVNLCWAFVTDLLLMTDTVGHQWEWEDHHQVTKVLVLVQVALLLSHVPHQHLALERMATTKRGNCQNVHRSN